MNARLKRIALGASLSIVLGISSAIYSGSASAQERVIVRDDHRIVNIVDDLLVFWDQARGMNLTRQRRAWFRIVEAKHKDYFDRAIYRGASEAERRMILDQFLLRVPSQINAIREFNKTAPALVSQALLDFRARFPEYTQQREIYIGPSLFRFDGSVRPVGSDTPDTLCVGADVLSTYTPEQVRIVIAHELFHLYHFSFLMRDASAAQFRTAHMPLMIEGMAVAGSEAVYPYQRSSLYLHFSEDEVLAQRDLLLFNSQRFFKLLQEGVTPDLYEPWFTSSTDKRIPQRGGYLLGYEVTRRLLATYTMEQLVRMTPAQLRQLAEEQLLAQAEDQILLLAGDN